MNIKVLFFGRLREVAQTSELNVALNEQASLSKLLEEIGKLHGRAFAEELNSIQGLRILINGREYQMIGGIETCLEDNDTVVLLPPIMGG